MYSVVNYDRNSKEVVSKPMTWPEAYAVYERQASKINAVDSDGKYIHPGLRIAIRKV